MTSFLEKTADHIIQNYRNCISEVCIVLPNRRAGIFFKTILSKKLQAPFWSPDVFSTEDFIENLSDSQIADSTSLLFHLYDVYQQIEQDKAQSFDDFLAWGTVLLHDFNEMDRYLVDPDSLFDYLNESRVLSVWNPGKTELTEFQKDYLKFWGSLKKYYFNFNDFLKTQNISYQGAAFRNTAEQIEDLSKKIKWKKIIFAGFNALNTSEETIIKYLVDTGQAEVLWDSDDYYVASPSQEAGRYIRKYKKQWDFISNADKATEFNWQDNNFATSVKEIEVIGVAKNVGQAKVASSIVSTLNDNAGLKNTALVLADEDLLVPVITSLPENVEHVNVTMGYAIQNTAAYALVESILNLHESANKLNEAPATETKFYHKNLIKVFGNSCYSTFAGGIANNQNLTSKLINEIIKNNQSFYTKEDLMKLSEGILMSCEENAPVFNNYNKKPKELLTAINQLLTYSLNEQQEGNKTDSLSIQFIHSIIKVNTRLIDLLEKTPQALSLQTLGILYRQISSSTTVPFIGEPLEGLQIMGMLETRTLDFENLILLSVNEEILPSGKTNNSFIPYDIKREFKLPGYTEKDAVFGYHFYRLLQKAKKIFLIYNTESDEMGGGEKSRFISQLIQELPKVNPSVRITERIYSASVPKEPALEIKIKKDEVIKKKIAELAEYGFSPSGLNSFKNCSMQFYYNYVAGLKAEDEVEETIDAATLGTIIHLVLERLFKPFIGKSLDEGSIKVMIKEAEEVTNLCFSEKYSSSQSLTGKNLLIKKVAHRYIQNFLHQELDFFYELKKEGKPLIIKALEEKLEYFITVGETNVKLKGSADRIDSVGNVTRIIDYKTGKVENRELIVSDIQDLIKEKHLNKSFQLLMYAYLYKKVSKNKNSLQSGIFSFRSLSSGLRKVTMEGFDDEGLSDRTLEEFEQELSKLISNLLSEDALFEQTSDIENCTHCNYANICNR